MIPQCFLVLDTGFKLFYINKLQKHIPLKLKLVKKEGELLSRIIFVQARGGSLATLSIGFS